METGIEVLEIELPGRRKTEFLIRKHNSSSALEKSVKSFVAHSRNNVNISANLGNWEVYDSVMGYIMSKGLTHKDFGEYSSKEVTILEDPGAIRSVVEFIGKIKSYNESVGRASENYASPETSPEGYKTINDQRNLFVAYAAFYHNKLEEQHEKASKASKKK